MFSFYFGQKRIAFVLSSSKWIDNLLTIKHSQNDKNSLFNTSLIFQHAYLDRRYNYPEHRGITQFHLIHVVNQLYVLGRGVVLRYIFVEHHNLLVQNLRRHLLVPQKFFSLEIWLKLFNDWLLKTYTFHFFVKAQCDITCQRLFCRSTRFMPVSTPFSNPLKIKSISCTRHEPV